MHNFVSGTVPEMSWSKTETDEWVYYHNCTVFGGYTVSYSKKDRFAVATHGLEQLQNYMGNLKMTVAEAKEVCYDDYTKQILRLLEP